MARSDLILNLLKASRRGDGRQLRRGVEALVAEERTENHRIFADRLLARLGIPEAEHAQENIQWFTLP